MLYDRIFAAAFPEGHAESEVESFSGSGSGSGVMENISSALVTTSPSSAMGVMNIDRVPGSTADPFDWTNNFNVSFISSVFGIAVCSQWGPVNHMYFQLANTFFFLSYLAPSGLYGMVYLRCTHLIGCALFALWGFSVICSFDAFLWNVNFVVINFIHVCILIYRLRPVKFTKEVEEVSINLYFLKIIHGVLSDLKIHSRISHARF